MHHETDESRRVERRAGLPRGLAAAMIVVALLLGVVTGRSMTGSNVRAAATEPNATATRAAELEELNRLRTQVAQTPVCTPPPSPTATQTPMPTATPTPTPPAAMGQPLAYVDNWTVVVNTFSAAPPTTEFTPAGKLVQVNVTVTNNANEQRVLPFGDWVLLDAQGRRFAMAAEATTQIHGPGWYLGSAPNLPGDITIVFDVAVDAGPGFILESTVDPTFRVAVVIQMLG